MQDYSEFFKLSDIEMSINVGDEQMRVKIQTPNFSLYLGRDEIIDFFNALLACKSRQKYETRIFNISGRDDIFWIKTKHINLKIDFDLFENLCLLFFSNDSPDFRKLLTSD